MTLIMAKLLALPFIICWEREYASFDKDTVDRLNSIQKMDANTQGVLFNVIDTYIQNFKPKQAFASK